MQGDQRVDPGLAGDRAVQPHLGDDARVVGVREDRRARPDRAVVADQQHGVEARVQSLHHVQRLVLAR